MNEELERLKAAGMYRELRVSRPDGARVFAGGRARLNFASNDYLGISARADMQAEFLESLSENQDFLFGSGGSRLLSGNHPAYERAEAEIGARFGGACLMFGSGYHANTGILPALAGRGDLILADRLAHASIIDALRLSVARWMRFAHNDAGHLRRLLSQNRAKFGRVFVATESVFSMDGDRAPLGELADLCDEFGAMLYVDEAHGFGVFGENGLGLCEAEGLLGRVSYVMCTLGKALAGEGAFVICSEDDKKLLVNRSRPLIFTTSMPPVNVMWTLFAFRKMLGMRAERARLKSLWGSFRSACAAEGVEILGDTQIAPAPVGSAVRAGEVSAELAREGVWAPCVRPPTVPANSSRIRFSLTNAMAGDDVAFCASALARALKKL